eukprot:CAMPEP_0174261844 /NCGR_PEP_ID=MMETSP0439-20130205/12444_1 /TAXON_ID=0 /ORGANISM="Stereomyxa ramosa, Strain Chinc5" /LENGTH=487 /DNA_ID=CAMNT_0015346437 /DNA_START=80 /DNA_END=1543 /DNA_ORIENTATION=+
MNMMNKKTDPLDTIPLTPMNNRKSDSKSKTMKMMKQSGKQNDMMNGTLEDQPTLCIGTIGHVAHGKSTLVRALTGETTMTHTREKERNSTIRLGYANARIFKCEDCPKPECYRSFGAKITKIPKCDNCGTTLHLVKHVSFVDCPGHEQLMATMLNGSAVMDAAILVVAANEPCPRPQTAEHVIAAEIMGLQNFIVLQNKVDLLTGPDAARKAYQNKAEIEKLIQGTNVEGSPIIPISAQLGFNVDVLLQYIVEKLPEPERRLKQEPLMPVIRSFDINKPGADWKQLKGAVLGGSLLRGKLNVGDQIEFRPGLLKLDEGRPSYSPLRSVVVSLTSDRKDLKNGALPGALIGIGTSIDPALGKDNGLVGQVLGRAGSLPEVYQLLQLDYHLMRRLVTTGQDSRKIQKLRVGDKLVVNIGPLTSKALVTGFQTNKEGKNLAEIKLAMPSCCEVGQRVAISRCEDKLSGWRIIGFGIVAPESVPLISSASP